VNKLNSTAFQIDPSPHLPLFYCSIGVRLFRMGLLEDVLGAAGFSAQAIEEVKAGKLHQGGSLDAASDKELSVKLALHVKGELKDVGSIFMKDPKKKEYDPTVESLGMLLFVYVYCEKHILHDIVLFMSYHLITHTLYILQYLYRYDCRGRW